MLQVVHQNICCRLFVVEIINVRAELINVSVVRRHTRMMYNVNVEA